MLPTTVDLAALEERVYANAQDPEALRLYGEALLARGDPLGHYIARCREEFGDPPLPPELEPTVFGELRHYETSFSTTFGILRGVTFHAAPPWEEGFTTRLFNDYVWRSVQRLTIPKVRARDVEKWRNIIHIAPHLNEVRRLPFSMFVSLCEEPYAFDALTIEGASKAPLVTALATAQLSVKQLTLPGDFGIDSPLHWLVSAARPVFDTIEALYVPGVSIAQAQPLLLMAGPSLLHLEGRDWWASRSDALSAFALSVPPKRDLPSKQWVLNVPAWAAPPGFALERTHRRRPRAVTLVLPLPERRVTAQRHLHVVTAGVAADEQCPFARPPWRLPVASLCGRRDVAGRVERLDSGTWLLTLEGAGVASFNRPLAWLPSELEPLLAVLPKGFAHVVREPAELDGDEAPASELHCFSSQSLLAHAWLRLDADDAAFQLAVYRTWEAWRAAAPDQRAQPTVPRVVARTSVGPFLAQLREQEPIDRNAEVFVARRLLERATERAQREAEQRTAVDLSDAPF